MGMLIDTSGWACYVDNRQLHHRKAVQLLHHAWQSRQSVVTSSYVLAELTALLNSPLRVGRSQQIQYVNSIRNNPFVTVDFVDPSLYTAAWSLWQSRPDKEWTLTDCASFVIMQQRRLTDALSTDHHFEQAGFVRLLK